MRPTVMSIFSLTCVLAMAAGAFGQGDYRVVAVTDGGTVSGTVKWSGPVPRGLDSPVTKDPQICDPDSKKTADLDRLIVGPEGGVANTVVYLKNISSGKAIDLPEQRRESPVGAPSRLPRPGGRRTRTDRRRGEQISALLVHKY